MVDEAGARERLERSLEGVHGWLTTGEAWRLHEEARRVAAARRRPVVLVELGAWKGRSAIALASGLAASGARGTVYSIDPQSPPYDNADEFRDNVARAGLSELVRPLRALSFDARPAFPETAVDVLFLDAAHDFPSVARDLDDWAPLLSDGAVLAVNDLFWPGVNFALKDRVARAGSPFRRPRYEYNTIFFDHLPGAPWSSVDRAECRRCRMFLTAGRVWLRAWNRIKDDPRVPVGAKRLFFVPTSRALWRLGPRGGRAV